MEVGLFDPKSRRLVILNQQQLILQGKLNQAQASNNEEKVAKLLFDLEANKKGLRRAQQRFDGMF